MLYIKLLLACFSILHLTAGDYVTITNNSTTKKIISKNCLTAYSLNCLKLDIVSWVDNLNENYQYEILPGVSVVRDNEIAPNTGDMVAELARQFPDDPEARLDAFFLRKIGSFLGSHSLQFKIWRKSDVQEARGGGGGGGGKKGGGGYGAILAMGAMMKGMMMSMAMAGIAAMAGKALMMGMISMMMSMMMGFKSMGGGEKHTTYEVVSKPVYSNTHSHSVGHDEHGHYGYARSLEVGEPYSHPVYKPDDFSTYEQADVTYQPEVVAPINQLGLQSTYKPNK